MRRYRDRYEAGHLLAESLPPQPGGIVLGLPRGGVPVAAMIARAHGLPLDVMVVRKLGLPGHEELAMGAIASGGVRVLNEELVHGLRVPDRLLDAVADRESRELRRRELAYRGARPYPSLRGRRVVLVDDGLATGATMRAAIRAVQATRPERVTVAVPVAAPEVRDSLAREVDELICLQTPEPFVAVGMWYHEFGDVSDDEVRRLLGVDGAEEARHV